MTTVLTRTVLARENERFRRSGGRSQENRSLGFRPAFMDLHSRVVYASRFADGRPAPFHVIDGLPDELVLARCASGRILAVKASVVSGFVRDGQFFSREEAANMVARAA